jgi:hypothetical protein
MSVLAIPMVSLMLNLLVTTIGSFNFIRNGHAQVRLIGPFLVSSIPMAYWGGTLQIAPTVFYWVLLVSLVFVAMRIYLWHKTSLSLQLSPKAKLVVSVLAGSVLGLISGVAGIGGGVYLVPLIIILGLGSEKQAAACGAIFIWLNSGSGLLARAQYNSIDLMEYLPLIVAVIAGGLVGSFLGSYRLSGRHLEKVLGLVIITAIVFLAKKLMD